MMFGNAGQGRVGREQAAGAATRSFTSISRRAQLVVAVAAVIAVSALAGPSSALAAECTDSWAKATSGSWFEASKWSTKEVPSSTDVVCITVKGTYTVTLEPTAGQGETTIKALTVGLATGAVTPTLLIASDSAVGGQLLHVSEGVSVLAHGTVALTSTRSGGAETGVGANGGITNKGTIATEPGTGGRRTLEGNLLNEGTIAVGAPTSYSNTTLTNEGAITASGGQTLTVAGGTFVQGAGTITGTAPVLIQSGTVSYAGSGKGTVAVQSGKVTGNIAKEQTLLVESNCSEERSVSAASSFTNAGTIELTSTCANVPGALNLAASSTLTNTGAIVAGRGGETGLAAQIGANNGQVTNKGTVSVSEATALRFQSGTLANEHNVNVADKASLELESATFTNSGGGTIAAVGSGHVQVGSNAVYAQGAGTTTGTEPVFVVGGTLSYTGSGKSTVAFRSGSVTGNIAKEQTLLVESNCSEERSVSAASNFTNAGTIELTSSCVNVPALMSLGASVRLTNMGAIVAGRGGVAGVTAELSGGKLSNKGTLSVSEAGTLRSQSVTLTNEGGVNVADKATLAVASATFTNGAGGTIAAAGSGHVELDGSSTFVEGAGTTSGVAPVLVTNDSNVSYVGTGESTIVDRRFGPLVTGGLAKGQTLRAESNCEAEAGLEFTESFTSAGTIELTSSCPGVPSVLRARSGTTLTNGGTISVHGLARQEGVLANAGEVAAADGASLEMASGAMFTNGAGGTIVGTGSGHVEVDEGATFVEGAGTTSGVAPVVATNDSTVSYAGGGESTIVDRRFGPFVTGNLSKGQTLRAESNCEAEAGLEFTETSTSAGTIELTSSCPGVPAVLRVRDPATLTNGGTIAVHGLARQEGALVNVGEVAPAAGASLEMTSGATFTNGLGGTVAAAASGHVEVDGGATFVEGAGTTSGVAPVVATNDSTVSYTGAGESTIVDRRFGPFVTGNLSKGQTLRAESNCEAEAGLEFTETSTSAGTIELTSSCAGEPAVLRVHDGGTLTNTGTIAVHDLARQEGALVNGGGVSLADAAALEMVSGATFTNGSGGAVAATGSGRVQVNDGTTFVEGAGTTSGAAPVLVRDGSLTYTGKGAGTIVERLGELSGNLSAGQNLRIEGNCEEAGSVTVAASFTNAGTIALTSGGCNQLSRLTLVEPASLTNNGTITAERESETARTEISGKLINAGTIAPAAGTELKVAGTYTQSKVGRLRATIASPSSFSLLNVTGLVALSGTLQVVPVGGFTAEKGQHFAVLSSPSTPAGRFEFEQGGAISSTLHYAQVYSSGGMTLEAAEGAPELISTNTAPPTVAGTVRQGFTLVLKHGAWTHEPFEYDDQWLRCDASGANCKAIPGADEQSYVLTKADAGSTIRVQEIVANGSGESAPADSAATVPVEAVALQAHAGESVTGVEGEPVTFDGSASTPAAEISDYRWEFGDGETEQSAEPVVHHAYAHPSSPGKPYEAKLTVFRGEASSTTTVQVTVTAVPTPAESVVVTVKDADGNPIAGADVLYAASSGPSNTSSARIETLSDGSGTALLAGLAEGTDTIYVYKSGFRPAAAKVTVNAQHHGSVTVTLQPGEVAASTLKSEELTLSQIEAAGIDTSDPANKNIWEFEIRLAFFDSPVPPVELHEQINSAGQFVGGSGGGGGGSFGASGGSGGWTCSPSECESTPGKASEPGSYRIVAVPEMIENHPLIQWLILKGKAAVLKQFFEVSMVTQNLSPANEGFTLTGGSATLNLPNGIALAPTPSPQTATQQVADIPGGGSATTNWIVRGDEHGEYWLSAAYHGFLQPFAAEVNTLATLQKPLHVWGAEALALVVHGEEDECEPHKSLCPGVPWRMELGVHNEAEVPLYNVELTIDENVHEHFIFQPDQQFGEMLGELKQEQTAFVRRPYVLVPDAPSESIFNPLLSSAHFIGEPVNPGANISGVPPVPLYTASALPDTPNKVHIQFQPVPGAKGYEVFSTPTLDTPFAAQPELASATAGGEAVAELPASATNAYIAGSSEARYYSVSALVPVEEPAQPGEVELVLDHPLVKASAGPGGPSAPEFGRCVAAASQKEGSKTVYHGGFTKSSCAEASVTHTGKYEWVPGVVKGSFASASTGNVKLETAAKAKLTCTGESSSGQITGVRSVGGVTITFTGCESSGQKCTTAGQGTGTLRSATLEGVLGFQVKATHKLALDLFPTGHTGAFVEYSCGGTPGQLTGSVLVPLKADKMSSAQSLKFKESKGKQAPEAFEGGEQDILRNGKGEPEGLGATLPLSFEEALEANAVV